MPININLGLTADATGTVDVITATYSPAPTLVDKKILFLVASGANTSTAPTFNPNALGARTIVKGGGQALVAGDIPAAGYVAILEYNLANTRWELLNPFPTKAGIGLGNVDNTSDANKPVSTAQAAADAAVLVSANTYSDSLVVGLWDDRGNFDASVNAYPSSGGSGTAGAILKGDIWTVSVGGTLPTGIVVVAGDTVRALVNTPGNTQSNWAVAENNIGYVPENVANKDTDGTLAANSDTKYASQKATKTYADTKVAKSSVPCEFIVACSDLSTALTTGTTKAYFRAPYAFTLTAVRASLGTAQATGNIFTVDINESGTTVLSTKLTIDNTEKTSTTAVTPPVISDSSIADDAELTIDIDQVGDGTAKGLIVTLIGTHAV